MTTFEQNSESTYYAPRRYPYSLLLIALMGTFTVSTPFPLIFGLPRPFLITLMFTVWMYFSLNGKITIRYIQFALAYLAAFVPATLYGLKTSEIKWNSVIEMIAMLGALCVLASYFDRWLVRNSDGEKKRSLELLLLYFFFISVLNLVFFSEFNAIKDRIYPAAYGVAYSIGDAQRELSLYGGRATAFFSEPSNYAKFLSIIIAAYMTITRCSKRSIAALLAFFLLVRSVSYFYAAPAMAFAWWRLSRPPTAASLRRIGPGAARILSAAVFGLCLAAAVLFTQMHRISKSGTGGDSSVSGRILLPLKFMATHADTMVTGYGLTPQDDIANFTVMTYAASVGYLDRLSTNIAATSTTITFLVAVGLGGLAIFCLLMHLMRGLEGIWIATAFLLSNFINSGFDSSTVWVLSALLITLLSYQARLSKEDRKRMIAELNAGSDISEFAVPQAG